MLTPNRYVGTFATHFTSMSYWQYNKRMDIPFNVRHFLNRIKRGRILNRMIFIIIDELYDGEGTILSRYASINDEC